MKRGLMCLLVMLCFALLVIPAKAAGEGEGWYIDTETKTLYISGQGSTADVKADGWRSNLDIEHVVIGEGITEIADEAFLYCAKLQTVQFPNTLSRIGMKAFEASGLTEVDIPKGITTIEKRTFFRCRSLTKVTLPDGLTLIGEDAFNQCSALKALVIPGSVTGFGINCFKECTSLEELRFLNGVTKLPNGAFSSMKALRYLEIPDSVESLKYVHFSYCTALETVRIGSGLKVLYEPTFDGCDNLKRFEISPANKTFCSVDGVIYSKDKTELIRLPLGYDGAYEVLPGTLRIGERAASNCTKLTALTVPDSVTAIGDYAFRECKSLETVTLGRGLTEIEQGAFYYCKNIKTLTLNEGLKIIWGNAFSDCESLTSLTIPSTVTLIRGGVFSGCTGLERIDFLGDKPEIWSQAFLHVGAEAYHPEGNTTWDEGRLDYDGYLIWPQDPTYEKYAGKCGELLRWELDPDTGVLTISGRGSMGGFSNNFFAVSDQVRSIVIEDGVLSMAMLGGMDQVKQIVLPASVRQVEHRAFYRWNSLEYVEVQGNSVSLDNEIFYECPVVKTIRFTGSKPYVKVSTFRGFGGTLFYPANDTTWNVDEWKVDNFDVLHEGITCIPEGELPSQPGQPDQPDDPKKPNLLPVLIWLIPVGAVILVVAVIAVLLIVKRK